jgi:hypothetical protein
LKDALLLVVGCIGVAAAFVAVFAVGRAICHFGGLAPEYAWAWVAVFGAAAILRTAK